MNRRLITALTAIVTLTAGARSWLHYDQTLAPYAWLRTANPASLTTFAPADSSLRSLGDAQLSLATGQGHWTAPGTSPNAWQARAEVRSVMRMGQRVVVRGGVDYTNRWGNEAAGSVWSQPQTMPFDIAETADTTLGRVRREQYALHGEAGVAVSSRMSLGARFAYTAASGTKQKDPRFTSHLMSLEAAAAAMWTAGRFTLGATYQMQRRTEAVQLSTHGRTDRVYHYLVDLGAAMGRDERTDGRGYTSSDSEHPLLDMRHGATAQLGYTLGPCTLLAEVQWMHRSGHYGLRSPSTVDFSRHGGDEWLANAWWQHSATNSLQRVEAQWSRSTVKNHENTYRIVADGGVTDIEYYDARLVGYHRHNHVRLAYDGQWGIRRALAQWQLQAAVCHSWQRVTAIVFPYYRRRRVHLTELEAAVTRQWLLARERVWSLTIQADWGTGGGVMADDGFYLTPSTDDHAPAAPEQWAQQHYQWLTATRLGAGLAVRYAFSLAGQRLRAYVDASYALHAATGVSTTPKRHQARLAIGITF